MTQIDYFNIGFQIIQMIILIVGIPLVLRQIGQQTDAIKLQTESFKLNTYMQLMSEATRISEMAINDKDIIDFYDDDKLPSDISENWENLSHKYRKFYLYFGRNMSLQEQTYLLWKMGWVDSIDYKANIKSLKELMELKVFRLWWPIIKSYYRSDFENYIDKIYHSLDEDFYQIAMIK